MSGSIGIRLTRAKKSYDLGASKFFGAPTVPRAWDGEFFEDEIFLCQIRLSDIAELDRENRLPHTGYLSVFLSTGTDELVPIVRYFDGEPELALSDFNKQVEGFESFNDAYLAEFFSAEEDYDGTRLFGIPSGWCYDEEPPSLLLQYDPLDNETGFLDYMDGYLYLFFGEDTDDLSKISLMEDFS